MDRRAPLVAATVTALLVATAVPALAHAGFDLQQLPVDSTETVELRVPIEIDAANAFVDVLVPEGWSVDRCDGAPGWSCATSERDDATTIVNLAVDDPTAGTTERFTLTMTAPPTPGTYAFPVVQTYDDGTEAAWIGEPGGDRPAPTIQVGDDATPVERTTELPTHGDADDTATVTDGGSGTEAASDPPSTGDASPSASPATATDEPPTVAEGEGDDGAVPSEDASSTPWAVVVLLAVAAVVAGVAVTRRRG